MALRQDINFSELHLYETDDGVYLSKDKYDLDAAYGFESAEDFCRVIRQVEDEHLVKFSIDHLKVRYEKTKLAIDNIGIDKVAAIEATPNHDYIFENPENEMYPSEKWDIECDYDIEFAYLYMTYFEFLAFVKVDNRVLNLMKPYNFNENLIAYCEYPKNQVCGSESGDIKFNKFNYTYTIDLVQAIFGEDKEERNIKDDFEYNKSIFLNVLSLVEKDLKELGVI